MSTHLSARARVLRGQRGTSLIEFAICLPFLLLVVLGVIETSYALLDQHIVTKLTREGANLISRNTNLTDAATALKSMSSRPVNFDNGNSLMIFSVIKNVGTTGASNYGKPVLYARYSYGTLAGKTSVLQTAGTPTFSAPDYEAPNSDNDPNVRITNLPAGLTVPGSMLYVTEIYTKHELITPFDKFGPTVPNTLYAIAYF